VHNKKAFNTKNVTQLFYQIQSKCSQRRLYSRLQATF